MNESGIIDSVGLREDAPFGQQSDEPSFEENVLAEERVRQRTLHSIRFQSRQRQDSVSSGEGDALRSLSAHGACAAGSVDGGALAVSTDRQDPNGVRAEVDVRQQLFEEPEAYPHTVDFQRVIITDTDGKSFCTVTAIYSYIAFFEQSRKMKIYSLVKFWPSA